VEPPWPVKARSDRQIQDETKPSAVGVIGCSSIVAKRRPAPANCGEVSEFNCAIPLDTPCQSFDRSSPCLSTELAFPNPMSSSPIHLQSISCCNSLCLVKSIVTPRPLRWLAPLLLFEKHVVNGSNHRGERPHKICTPTRLRGKGHILFPSRIMMVLCLSTERKNHSTMR